MLFDEQGNLIKEGFEQARRDYLRAERARFKEVYAPEIAGRETSFWEFPYTEVSPAIMEYERSRFYNLSNEEAEDFVDEKVWEAFKATESVIRGHFGKVLEAVEGGTFEDCPLTYDEDTIDVTPIVQSLAGKGYNRVDILGDIHFEGGDEVRPEDTFVLGKGTLSVPNDGVGPVWEDGYSIVYSDQWEDENGEPVTGGRVMQPYSEGDYFYHFGFVYLAMHALVTLLDCDEQVRQIVNVPDPKKVESVTLAQYAKADTFQIHGFTLKTLNEGLEYIGTGNPYYELAPKGKHSKEIWRLTASENACTEYLQKGGNSEVIKAVLGTVNALRNNAQAADFIHKGRIYFTLNKIVEECLRTTAGTIHARDNQTAREVIDAALVVASGAQIGGTDAKGDTTSIFYLIDAIRVDEVEFNGNRYTDVWGFLVDAKTISEYEQEQGHTYHYPLLESKRPFTIDTLAINEYLSDALNEARGHLYTTTRAGQVKQKKAKKKTIKRAWKSTRDTQGIFDRFSPVHPLSSRQKTKIVKMFEQVLTDLVRQEARGRREGMPLYVYAYSERNAAVGRGKGEYVNLVLEVSSEFHTVRDGEKTRGSVNLQDGPEAKKPLDC